MPYFKLKEAHPGWLKDCVMKSVILEVIICLHRPIKEAFIRNFSAPYSLLQRHLVGEEEQQDGEGETGHPDKHQHSSPRPLITELNTASFLPSVMDVQKVRKDSNAGPVPNQPTLNGSRLHNSPKSQFISMSPSNSVHAVSALYSDWCSVWRWTVLSSWTWAAVCSPVGCSAVLLHSVVWILFCPQPRPHPAGQVITGKRHHHCRQVQYVLSLALCVSTLCLK